MGRNYDEIVDDSYADKWAALDNLPADDIRDEVWEARAQSGGSLYSVWCGSRLIAQNLDENVAKFMAAFDPAGSAKLVAEAAASRKHSMRLLNHLADMRNPPR